MKKKIVKKPTKNSHMGTRIKVFSSPPYVKMNRGIAQYLRKNFVMFKIRYARGLSYYDFIKQPALVFVALTAIKYFSGLPTWIFFAFVPFWFIGWTAVGWYDQYKAKIWQEEAQYSQRHINPFEKEVLERIKKIQNKVNKLEKKS